jgi:hypothetical protein
MHNRQDNTGMEKQMKQDMGRKSKYSKLTMDRKTN